MLEIPTERYYTEEHEYLRRTEEEGIFLVGVTDYAQGELGDVVYVELPAPGATFERMEPFGTIEAVKAVADLYCPVRGEIVEVNEVLHDDPALVNSDPYGEGWMVRLRVLEESDLDDLMDAAGYANHIGED